MSESNELTPNPDFSEISRLIDAARQRAYQAVNTTLIELYWQVGAYLSRKIAAVEWGESIVEQLAQDIATTQPGVRGFSAKNIWRMRQFFEAYSDSPILSALPRELPWTHNLTILSRSKRTEEREFYLKMAVQEKCSSRELERQFNTALFERVVLTPTKISPLVRQFKFAVLRLEKLSTTLREIPPMVSALLTQTVEPPRHPRVLLSGIQPHPLALHSLRSDSRQKPAGMTILSHCA